MLLSTLPIHIKCIIYDTTNSLYKLVQCCNFCLALRYGKNLKERKYNEEKKSLLTCLKEEISIKKTQPTEEETVLETIKLIDRLEAAVCSKK